MSIETYYFYKTQYTEPIIFALKFTIFVYI